MAPHVDVSPPRRLRLATRLGRCLPVLVLAAAFAGAAAPAALGSEPFPDTSLKNLKLAVNARGEALVTYTRTDGKTLHVLVWGAVDANTPSPDVPQVRFKYDYAGGWGKYHSAKYWKTFKNVCAPYTGPTLLYATPGAACDAPDGSHWALQTWQRALPLLGFDPWLPAQTAFETHISHWSAPLATLEVSQNWTYNGSAVGLFGQYEWGGAPVYGFSSTKTGGTTSRYNRNMYIDTYNSVYGAGWKRESGILTHKGTGTFCHSFVPQRPFPDYPSQSMRPAAPGKQYRVTAMGPGVTPDVQWVGPGLGAFDERVDVQYNSLFDRVMTGDRICAGER
ncbi:MAG: hypothetical protein QOE29_162 [Gaiellaceae bacterium]|nr:hypothetical protein [Gaiellaceae bacterium]